MFRMILFPTVAVLALGLLSACATAPAGQVAAPTAGGGPVITLADQGQTVHLTVGQSFLLKLGADYTWNIAVSDGKVISQVPNVPLVYGAQGIYVADAAGTATLTAAGDPVCRQVTPACSTPSIQFSVTVVVK